MSHQKTTSSHPILAGLTVIAPLLGTFLIITLLYKPLRKAGEKLLELCFQTSNFLFNSHLSINELPILLRTSLIIILPILLVYILGLFHQTKLGGKGFNFLNRLLKNLPLIGFIYQIFQQITESAKALSNTSKFQGVAYIESTQHGHKLLGFITGRFVEKNGNPVTSIFLPTSPNPATGFVVIVDDEKVHPSSLTIEEAGKMIVSAGLITPDQDDQPL